MISVLQEENKDAVQQYFKDGGFEYTENSKCVVARDGQEVLGFCLFSLDSKQMTVLDLEPKNDLLLADGILRAALHVAAQRSIIKVHYTENSPAELFTKLGFIKSADEKTLDINKLFTCNCEK